MRVRDLEIAMVLAREMKAAAARSVDPSLRVEQLQEVFGAEQLDRAERTRIQTALQMAGLEPRPSLLEADPGTAIRFGIGENAPAPSPEPSQAPAGEPQGEPSRDEFPTVGEFARSTFQRARRRFSGAGEANGRHETVIATAEAAAVDEAEAEHVATDPDHPAGPAFVEHHVDEIQSPSFGGPSESPDAPAAGEDPFDFEDPEDVEEPAEQDEPDAGQETVVHELSVL